MWEAVNQKCHIMACIQYIGDRILINIYKINHFCKHRLDFVAIIWERLQFGVDMVILVLSSSKILTSENDMNLSQ